MRISPFVMALIASLSISDRENILNKPDRNALFPMNGIAIRAEYTNRPRKSHAMIP